LAEPAARKRRGLASRLRRVAAVVLPFILWQLAAESAQNRLVPPPTLVFETLWDAIESGLIWDHGKITFARGLVGLGIAIAAGLAIGFAMARSRWVDAALHPTITALYPVPKLALFPVFILILGFGAWSKIALVALECAYPVIYNTYDGVQRTQRSFLWVARNVGAGRWERAKMFMRAATPSVMAALRMAVPIMLVVMVVTEFLGESRGLGYLIRRAGTEFEPESALAVILLLGIIGFVLDRLVVFLTRRLAFWERGVEL
jgi:ABC-type nitrate/sulfonate/bicarbonate transport system permease component